MKRSLNILFLISIVGCSEKPVQEPLASGHVPPNSVEINQSVLGEELRKARLKSLEACLWPKEGGFRDPRLDSRSRCDIVPAEKAAFDLGELALPVLQKALLDDEVKERQGWAARMIATIGGEQARHILQSVFQESGDLLGLLCFAMSSTGTKADERFLINTIQSEVDVDNWWEIDAAALSLGVLRSEAAKEALSELATKEKRGILSSTAARSLEWIENGEWNVPQIANANERDEVILSMFRCGIPRSEESEVFYEEANDRIWKRSDRAWQFEPIDAEHPQRGAPKLYFNVFITQDRERALARVEIYFDMMNASGFLYTLRKNDEQWKVSGILFEWIS